MIGRARTLAAIVAVASACTCAVPPSPTLESISPDRAPSEKARSVLVRGSGFVPWVQADLDAPEASTVHATFALALVRQGERVPLDRVQSLSDSEISARVPALPVAAVYDLELVDPRGRAVVLPGAFTIEGPAICGPDGTACDDGNACTQGDLCLGGACIPGASTCGNTAPRACLAVAPSVATTGEPFALDASCSSDAEDPASALQARLDLDGDGIWDTSFTPADTVIAHAYPAPGLWGATVEVLDTGGLSAFASRFAVVTAPGEIVRVTTAADEDDPDATPATPGGTGLSLREAVAHVNALAEPRTIHVAVAEPIVHATPLPALAVAAARVVGDPGATLDFPRVNQACVILDAPDQLLLGVTVTGCTNTAVLLGPSSGGSRVAECTIGPAPTAVGIGGLATGTIGPRNAIAGVGTAVRLAGSGYVVEENRIRANDEGIVISGGTATVRRNRIVSNGTSGLQATPTAGACTAVHNVFDANADDGILLANVGGGLVARNNLFTGNGGFGIRAPSAGAILDHNGFFANGLGPISSASPGPSDLLADPLYAGDHRLAPGSPAIDRGIDTGLDVNGPAAGSYDGAAPDLGAWEAPYPAP